MLKILSGSVGVNNAVYLLTVRSGPMTSYKDTMIREKAQLVRAEFPGQEMDSQLGAIKEDGPELIGPANQMQSCDSSGNSSTGLLNDHSTLEKASCRVWM